MALKRTAEKQLLLPSLIFLAQMASFWKILKCHSGLALCHSGFYIAASYSIFTAAAGDPSWPPYLHVSGLLLNMQIWHKNIWKH